MTPELTPQQEASEAHRRGLMRTVAFVMMQTKDVPVLVHQKSGGTLTVKPRTMACNRFSAFVEAHNIDTTFFYADVASIEVPE